KNLGDIVWGLLESYDIQEKLVAVMSDNASNNDTMMETIKTHMTAKGILFSAEEAHLRCMPHTIHLAALKLLNAIGALKSTNCRTSNYQESVSAPLDPDYNNLEASRNDNVDNTLTDSS
ncbi:uncharacterized protein FOMMEDRAFT_50517, partial [Fomitiporia mediterranea MF3/22]|uniref:uncharacterized protein n=1 Tax=Fomitiporia mediterranea (strain MF3/22) TaxID=694068 RepID=UPI00044079B5